MVRAGTLELGLGPIWGHLAHVDSGNLGAVGLHRAHETLNGAHRK